MEIHIEKAVQKKDNKVEKLQTELFQQAIDTVANEGGGTIIVEAGEYLIGSIFLKSNCELHLKKGAVILGSQELADYVSLPNRVAGIDMDWPAGVLNIFDSENVRISGQGKINGQGSIWWERYWGTDRQGGLRKAYTEKGLRWIVDYDCKRPRNILVFNSHHIMIEGLQSDCSGFWNTHICYSHHVEISDMTIENGSGPSTDGIDIDSCEYVTVKNCHINCNDDSICIKSGRGKEAMELARPSAHIEIRNCTLGLGEGITLGSEVSGGIYDIKIKNITFKNTNNGFRIKSAETRGGYIKQIEVSDLIMQDVAFPILIDLVWNPSYSYGVASDGNQANLPIHWQKVLEDVKGEAGLTDIDHIEIKNIQVKNTVKKEKARLCFINGYQDKNIHFLTLRNIEAAVHSLGEISHVQNLFLDNIQLDE